MCFKRQSDTNAWVLPYEICEQCFLNPPDAVKLAHTNLLHSIVNSTILTKSTVL